jgi:hypothetical protein
MKLLPTEKDISSCQWHCDRVMYKMPIGREQFRDWDTSSYCMKWCHAICFAGVEMCFLCGVLLAYIWAQPTETTAKKILLYFLDVLTEIDFSAVILIMGQILIKMRLLCELIYFTWLDRLRFMWESLYWEDCIYCNKELQKHLQKISIIVRTCPHWDTCCYRLITSFHS